MRMDVTVELNLKTEEVTQEVIEANRLAMRDTVMAVAGDTIKGSPVKTGNNRRSIAAEVSGMGLVASGGEGGSERMVDDNKIEGAVFSTSGYGGILEVGHHTSLGNLVPARPYFKPALDKNFTQEKYADRVKRHLK